MHSIQDDIDRFLCVAGLISVLDAQYKCAAGVFCIKPVEQRGARAADVQIAGWARREPNPNRRRRLIGQVSFHCSHSKARQHKTTFRTVTSGE